MKKTIFLSALYCFLNLISFSQAPNWQWASSAGGSGLDTPLSCAVDTSGNTYIAGYFQGTSITFGSTSFTNNNNDGSDDLFLAKYDVNGNVLWAKSAGGSSVDEATAVTIDASGNAYVVGYFWSPSITFGSNTLVNNTTNESDLFIVKYDPSGSVLWAKRAGGNDMDIANAVTTDTNGNIYVAGFFASPTIAFGTTTLTSAGYIDMFLAKYDSNGNVIWAKKEEGTDGDAEATSVVVDRSGYIYVTGWFYSSSISFGSSTLYNADNSASSIDLFIVKYNVNGSVVWAKSASGGINDEYPQSIIVDASNNIVIAGYFYSPTLNFSTSQLYNADNSGNTTDMFVAKYSVNGNILWAKSSGGNNNDAAFSVTADTSNNIYAAGGFTSPSITFGSSTLTNAGGNDVFVVKYGSNGNVNWVKKLGGNNSEGATSITTDLKNNLFLTGAFSSPSLTFDSYTLSNVGSLDIYLAKLNNNLASACSAQFTLVPDSTILHHYYIVNNAAGVPPLTYLWSWGDGTYDSIAYPSHTYSAAGYYTICLGITDSTGCTSTYCDSTYLQKSANTVINIDVVPPSGSGIHELNNSLNISIYPNPSYNNITIAGSQNSEIQILNIEGQILKSFITNETYTTIDVSGFAKGMYFVKVKTENGIAIKKFIKE